MSPLYKDLCPADGQVPPEGEHLSTDYMEVLRGSADYETKFCVEFVLLASQQTYLLI